MPVPDRFRKVEEFRLDSGVRRARGRDEATGRPVHMYEFDPGEARFEPGGAAAPAPGGSRLPRTVDAGNDDASGWLVVSLPPGARRWSPTIGPLSQQQLLEFARSLREGAEAGLVHGDLRPERLYLVRQSVLIEGFGLPWRPEPGEFTPPEYEWGDEAQPTPAGDVWAWSRCVEATGAETDDPTVLAVLQQCRAPDPAGRPDAAELVEALEQLLDLGNVPRGRSGRRVRPGAASAAATTRRRPGPPAPGSSRSPAPQAPLGVQAEANLRSHEQPPEGGDGKPSRPGIGDGFLDTDEDHAGGEAGHGPPEVERGGENRTRIALLGTLMAAVVILALLSIFWPGSTIPASPGGEATVYVVEVGVEPPDLPPVTIHLVSSPPDSSLAGGDRLGTAPRHLALDRPGTWAFRGSVGDQSSEVVTLEVPEERTLTLSIPTASGD